MRRRIIRIMIWGLVVVVVAVAITAVLIVWHLRALGSERNTPVDCRNFVTPDASCFLLLELDTADAGVADFFAPLIAAYDEQREKAAGVWERRAYSLLGFDRPSDAITRALPAECAFIVRYDAEQSRFHSHAAVSVSGLAGLLKRAAGRLPSLVAHPGVTLAEQHYEGERLFVAQNGAGPPSAKLEASDFTAIFAPLSPPGGGWSVVDNNLLLARRADSLAFAVDHLRSTDAAASKAARYGFTKDVDASGILTNRHGEFAALIEFAARTMGSKLLDRWLASERAKAREDMATLQKFTVTIDVQPGDRIVATFRVQFSDVDALTRVLLMLDKGFKEIKPPPPIKFKTTPDFTLNGVGFRVTATGVREYLRRRLAAGSQ